MSFGDKFKVDFQRVVDDIAKQPDGRNHSKMKHKYSPTELCGCVRNAYFSRLFPEEFDDRSYRNFLLGNTLHDLVQDNLVKVLGDRVDFVENEKAAQFLLPKELVDGRRVVISGRLDSIIFLKGSEKPYVVDYKTTANAYYCRDEPKIEHVKQVNYYMGAFLSDCGAVIYLDKRSLWVCQHEIVFSQELFDEVVGTCAVLDNSLSRSEVPVVDVVKMKSRGCCAYCRHKDRCVKEGISV